ncbi:MAG: hypothetical protein D6723_00335 [Acidobacteria bacterium]|nr:MAG: hypothetical protein D6723_00335 [Acidobacteriota bacterium]
MSELFRAADPQQCHSPSMAVGFIGHRRVPSFQRRFVFRRGHVRHETKYRLPMIFFSKASFVAMRARDEGRT